MAEDGRSYDHDVCFAQGHEAAVQGGPRDPTRAGIKLHSYEGRAWLDGYDAVKAGERCTDFCQGMQFALVRSHVPYFWTGVTMLAWDGCVQHGMFSKLRLKIVA